MKQEKIILLASTNQNKLKEVKEITKDLDYRIVSPKEIAKELEVVEDADSFAGNASLKAQAYHELLPDYYILADDSGLAIDALNGRPGIYSARYGNGATYPEKFKMIWQELKDSGVDETKWTAQFVCALAWWEPGKPSPIIFQAEMYGKISPEARGENGFGYDPIFYLDEYQKTSAEIAPELKNKISHRGKALAKWEDYLRHEHI